MLKHYRTGVREQIDVAMWYRSNFGIEIAEEWVIAGDTSGLLPTRSICKHQPLWEFHKKLDGTRLFYPNNLLICKVSIFLQIFHYWSSLLLKEISGTFAEG